MNKVNIIKSLALLSVVLTTGSCAKQLTPFHTNGHIGCIVDCDGSKASGSAASTPGTYISRRTIKGGTGFDLIETVYENELPLDGYVTKGKQITEDGADGSINIQEDGFKMAAYAESNWWDNTKPEGEPGSRSNPNTPGSYFTADVTYSGEWAISGSPKWLNNVFTTFWCWDMDTDSRISPSYTAGLNPLGNLSFSYSLPDPDSSEPYDDAVNQKDMVLSYNSEYRSFLEDGSLDTGHSSGSRTDDKINIRFYHALCAIQFFTGNIPDGYRISRISLKNVAGSANFSVAPGTFDNAKKRWPLIFTCSGYGATATYSQDCSINDSAIADRSSSSTRNLPGDTKTFFMIPCTFGAGTDAALEVTITNGSKDIVNTFSLENSSWDAGKYYTYKISAAGEVSVTINETCPIGGNTKSNVNFTNDNNVPEYFRAAVTANWYDNSGCIVAPWDPSAQGTFSGLPGSGSSTGWSLESDGYYYLMEPVAAGATSANLFNQYTLPPIAPVTGAHLEMTILVQAVAAKEGVSCTAAFTATP